ncbi:MAG: hypothetical protein H8D90_01745, partial [Candidatus Omnitrophica bacterium]|nr:hypothetical protein [Candidatus Omnitrophota bacterium]
MAQSQLRNRLGETVFETWILPLKPRFKDGSCVILEAPDKFFKEWVESHYSQSIQEALNSLSPVSITVDLRACPPKEGGAPARTQTQQIKPPESLHLNSRYTFENFITGPSNRHSHAYAL